MTREYQDYLAHFGILGMKWGVRRFQNEDGSLTAEGRERYGVTDVDRAFYAKEKARDAKVRQEMQRRSAKGGQADRVERELVEQYVKDGLSREKAEIEAFEHAKHRRLMKQFGTVMLASTLAMPIASIIQKVAERKGSQNVATNAFVALNAAARVSGLSTSLTLLAAGNDSGHAEKVYSRQYRYDRFIDAYKKEHPNTKLSDSEILEMQLGR